MPESNESTEAGETHDGAAALKGRPRLPWATAGGYAIAIAIVVLNVRERFFLPVGAINWLFGGLIVAGLIVDLAWKGSRGGSPVARWLVDPFLFLLSLLPMLWFLFGAWGGLYPNYYLFGGILPYSDAITWVDGAKRLLATGELSELSANRPMGICLIATLLALTDQDYQQSLILLVSLAGLATYFAAREVRVAAGIGAAALFVAVCVFLMAPWLAVFMTETTGFILGCIGFAWLLRGFRCGSFGSALVGMGFFVFAMLTRMGAMFAVPLVALYVLYFFCRANVRSLLVRGAAIGGVCIAAAGLSLLLFKLLGPERAAFQGNAYYILYGIASGGETWDFVLREHPETIEFRTPTEQSRYVKALFLEKFAADRLGFFRTVARLIGVAAAGFHRVLFPFHVWIRAPSPAIPGVLALAAFGFLFYPACRRRTPLGFLLPCAVGVLLSFPFVIVEAGIRVYAATYSFVAALAAAAPGLLAAWVWNRRSQKQTESDAPVGGAAGEGTRQELGGFRWANVFQAAFAAVVISGIAAVPLVLSFQGKAKPRLPRPVMAADGKHWREVVFYLNPRSGFVIARETRFGEIIEASAGSVVKSPGFGPEVNLAGQLFYGNYVCDLFVPRATISYAVFDALPIRSGLEPGYVRAVVRPIFEGRPWPTVYRVERFEFVDP